MTRVCSASTQVASEVPVGHGPRLRVAGSARTGPIPLILDMDGTTIDDGVTSPHESWRGPADPTRRPEQRRSDRTRASGHRPGSTSGTRRPVAGTADLPQRVLVGPIEDRGRERNLTLADRLEHVETCRVAAYPRLLGPSECVSEGREDVGIATIVLLHAGRCPCGPQSRRDLAGNWITFPRTPARAARPAAPGATVSQSRELTPSQLSLIRSGTSKARFGSSRPRRA